MIMQNQWNNAGGVFVFVRRDNKVLAKMLYEASKDTTDQYTHQNDCLITNEERYTAFCRLTNLDTVDERSYFAYLGVMYKTYEGH